MAVNSGYRCPKYNNEISGSGLNGPHTIAAADIAVAYSRAFELIYFAIEVGFTGIGVEQKGNIDDRFIHLDTLSKSLHRIRPTVWSYP